MKIIYSWNRFFLTQALMILAFLALFGFIGVNLMSICLFGVTGFGIGYWNGNQDTIARLKILAKHYKEMKNGQ